MNPFRYGCVVAGENYCRRPELQRQLAELVDYLVGNKAFKRL